MLLLSRKKQQSIVIDGRITVTVLDCDPNCVRFGISAPAEISIVRDELLTKQQKEFASTLSNAA